MPHHSRQSQAEVPSVTSYGQVIEYIAGMAQNVSKTSPGTSLTCMLFTTQIASIWPRIPTRQMRRRPSRTTPSKAARQTKDHHERKRERRVFKALHHPHHHSTSASIAPSSTTLSTPTLVRYTSATFTDSLFNFMKCLDIRTMRTDLSCSGAMPTRGVSSGTVVKHLRFDFTTACNVD